MKDLEDWNNEFNGQRLWLGSGIGRDDHLWQQSTMSTNCGQGTYLEGKTRSGIMASLFCIQSYSLSSRLFAMLGVVWKRSSKEKSATPRIILHVIRHSRPVSRRSRSRTAEKHVATVTIPIIDGKPPLGHCKKWVLNRK